MSMFFKLKPDEKPAVAKFKKSCTHAGMSIHLSQRSLQSLKMISGGNGHALSEPMLSLLERKGMARTIGDGTVTTTEIGILTLALGEAGGLI